jgi:hypothetical protein
MELIHNEIPLEFLHALPEGIKYVVRHGKDFLVVEEVTCPNGHSLMSENVRIHGEPSLKIGVEIGNEKGHFFIDAFWGSHKKLFDFIPPLGPAPVIVKSFCPTCGTSLIVEDLCSIPDCKTKEHILLLLPGKKNRILVCARLGCPGHRLEVQELPHEVTEKISGINFFGTGIDDYFGGI